MKNDDEYMLFVEETTPEGYNVLWRNGPPQEAMDFLVACPSKNRIELWSKAHAASPKGFAPMAFREANSDKVMVATSFKMLCLE